MSTSFYAAAVTMCALGVGRTSAGNDMSSIPEIMAEKIWMPSPPSAASTTDNSGGWPFGGRPAYVFLQKYPADLLFWYTEMLICPQDEFSQADQATLEVKIDGMTDFAEIDKSWWSTKKAKCVELGYVGGDDCNDACCGVYIGKDYILSESRAIAEDADKSKRSLYIYGKGNFDGKAALHAICDHRCWSDWTGNHYDSLTNNANTFTSTVLHNVYGLSQKKPGLGISDVVTVSGHCSVSPFSKEGTTLSQATASMDLCAMLNNKSMEGIATKKFCGKIGRVLNMTIPTCQASTEKLWGVATEMCQKGTNVEKWFCEVASDEQKRETFVHETCAQIEDFQMKMFNVSLPDAACHSLVENAFHQVAQICPRVPRTVLSQQKRTSDYPASTVEVLV